MMVELVLILAGRWAWVWASSMGNDGLLFTKFWVERNCFEI